MDSEDVLEILQKSTPDDMEIVEGDVEIPNREPDRFFKVNVSELVNGEGDFEEVVALQEIPTGNYLIVGVWATPDGSVTSWKRSESVPVEWIAP